MDDRFRRRIVWAFGISLAVNTMLIAILFWLVVDSRSEPPQRANTSIRIPGPGTDFKEPADFELQRQIDQLRQCQRYPQSLGC